MLPCPVTCSPLLSLPSADFPHFRARLLPCANSSRINTYKFRISNPFRMNTYKITGVGGAPPAASGRLSLPLCRPAAAVRAHSLADLRKTALLFSTTYALFLHSLAVCGNSSPIISITCALFAKTPGVYPYYSQNGTVPRVRGQRLFVNCRSVPVASLVPPLTLLPGFSSLTLHTFFPFFGGPRAD
jgi:hypothetical protein